MSEHPPIHEPKGVSYWDENMKEYLLDPTPDINTRPAPEDRVTDPVTQPIVQPANIEEEDL